MSAAEDAFEAWEDDARAEDYAIERALFTQAETDEAQRRYESWLNHRG